MAKKKKDEPEPEPEPEGKKEKKKKEKKKKEPPAEVEAVAVEETDGIGALIKEFLNSKTWTTLVMTATFFALFQVDVCAMYFSKRADKPLGYLTLGWFIVFCFEMLMNFVFSIDYGANKGLNKITFYMILDLVGTVSLIPDFMIIFGVTTTGSGDAMLARVARTARIGTPAALRYPPSR